MDQKQSRDEKNKTGEQIIMDARRHRAAREKEYREKALKMYPHLCARCGREFSGKKLRELTVHHKDHNHDNNQPDGANWELLCLYCHDHEHQEYLDEETIAGTGTASGSSASAMQKPFAGLEELLKQKKKL